MHSTEILQPDLFTRPEAPGLTEADLSERLGGVALHAEISIIETSYIHEGLQMLHAEAHGVDVRPEDAGRIYDPAKAHEAALEEEVARVHEAALHENEMFDIHTAALLENEMFNAHTEALAEDEERAQSKEQPSAGEAHKPDNAPKVEELNHRQEAELALKKAGYSEEIPVGSLIEKDFATGNLMIISHHEVKMIEPQPGGVARVIDYRFNDNSEVLTIRGSGGKTLGARPGEYMAGDIHSVGPGVITLPPAIARMTGFRKAVPLSRPARG